MKRLLTFITLIISMSSIIGQSVNIPTSRINNSERNWDKINLDNHPVQQREPLNSLGFKQKQDSIVHFYRSNVQDPLVKSTFETTTYYPNELLATYQSFGFSALLNIIVNGRKTIYVYDINDNMTTRSHYDYDTANGTWELDSKWEYSYDVNNNVFYGEYFYWDSSLSVWDIFYKVDYTYTANLDLEFLRGYLWNSSNSVWVDDYKEVYVYNANNEKVEYEEYSYSVSTNAWEIDLREEFTYDLNGNLVAFINYKDNTQNGQYSEYNKTVSVYNSAGMVVSDETFMWNVNQSQWDDYARRVLTYNSYNDLINAESEYSDYGTWRLGTILGFTHDVTVPNSNLVLPSEPWSENQLLERNHKMYSNNQLYGEINSVYYYSDFNPASINEYFSLENIAYPNPFTNNISFNLGEKNSVYKLELFNVIGEKVLEQSITNNQTISTDQLHNGVYFYSITNKGTKVFYGKLIKN